MSLLAPLTMTNQAAACCFPLQALTRSQARRGATTPMTTRQRELRPLGCAEWPHRLRADRPPAQDAWPIACLSWPSQATTTQLQPPRDNRMATRDTTKALRPRVQPLEHAKGLPWPEMGWLLA
jgi:hypothetical protein